MPPQLQVCVRSNYELLVTFHSYNNTNHRLARFDRCCDENSPCSRETCDTYFQLCLSTVQLPPDINVTESEIDTICPPSSRIRTDSETDTDTATFSDFIFDTLNPISLTGKFSVGYYSQ